MPCQPLLDGTSAGWPAGAFGDAVDPAQGGLHEKRILLNLVSNAIRYTDRGGVMVGCRRRGRLLRIEVWDSGIGIAAEQLPQPAVGNETEQPLPASRRLIGEQPVGTERFAPGLQANLQCRNLAEHVEIAGVTLPDLVELGDGVRIPLLLGVVLGDPSDFCRIDDGTPHLRER